MKVAFFGSSLVSAYWNGAATYYRGILKALAGRGFRITFYEPDAFDRQRHRDIADPPWAKVIVYPSEEAEVIRALEMAKGADVVIKASGVGVFDELLEREVLALQRPGTAVIFWDVDAPATLDRMASDPTDSFRTLVPRFDLILTYGGGDPVVAAYRSMGARECIPIYNALDPTTHHPVPQEARFVADLTFLGNRLPDREKRVEEFFLTPASQLRDLNFILGGSGWGDKSLPGNVNYLGHVFTADHNALNCSARAVLNINRESMASYGFSPPTRIFEAAGAAACLISDAWPGVELFLEPGREILLADSGADVAAILARLSRSEAVRIGQAALRRVLAEHTYGHRAAQVDTVLGGPELRRLVGTGR
jgi:spore maturation protein CgeB